MKYSLRSLMRFSIRDLFWLTIVIALVVGWWLDRSRLYRLWDDEFTLRIESEAAMAPTPERLRELRKRVMLPNSSAPAPKSPED